MKTIAITLYRRPTYTRQLFDALDRCYGIDEHMTLISCDFSEEHADACLEVRNIAVEFAASHLGHAAIKDNNPPLGIDKNKLAVLDAAFSKSDYVVFLEDDTPPAQDALRYFEAMNDLYGQDPNVVSISGYNRYLEETTHQHVVANEAYAVDHGTGFCPWGWSMRRDRYEQIVGKNGENYLNFCKPRGNDGNGLFDHYITYWMSQNQPAYTVYPVLPRTNHVGGHNATHTPSPQWLMENEFSPYGAWSQEMPDPHFWDCWTHKWN